MNPDNPMPKRTHDDHPKTSDPAVGSTRLVSTVRCECGPWPMAGLHLALSWGAVRCGIIGGPLPTAGKWISREKFWQVRIGRIAVAFTLKLNHAEPLIREFRLCEHDCRHLVELQAYREGGVTEEILRRNNGYIKIGRGCVIALESDMPNGKLSGGGDNH
jgi:hypothetical protein